MKTVRIYSKQVLLQSESESVVKMPTLLTNQQKSELALDYHKNGSVTQAWRNFKMKHSIYSKHYQQPCHKSIKRWLKNILTTGSVNGGTAGSTTGGCFFKW